MQSHEEFMEERKKLFSTLGNFNEHQHSAASGEQKLTNQTVPLPAPTVVEVPIPAAEEGGHVAEALREQTAEHEAEPLDAA